MADEANTQSDAPAEGAGVASRTILVVDDNKDAVDLMEEILVDEGYTVITAYSGIQAIEKAKENKCDLVLLDLMMPDFTGMHVSVFLADLPHKMPIIIVTAWDSDQFRGWADETAQVVGFLAKPIDRQKLLEDVAKALAEFDAS